MVLHYDFANRKVLYLIVNNSEIHESSIQTMNHVHLTYVYSLIFTLLILNISSLGYIIKIKQIFCNLIELTVYCDFDTHQSN